eukprot:jgi/Psemu1/25528/gm1.25528_g
MIIQDIAIQFGTFNAKDDAHKHEDLNKTFTHCLEYTDGLFITDNDAGGPKTLAPDPVTMLREINVNAIMDIILSKERTATQKQTLDGQGRRTSHQKWTRHHLHRNQNNTLGIQTRLRCNTFCQATTVADKTSNAFRACFANLPQQTYIKPKAVPLQHKPIQPQAAPPNTAILTVPIKPVESEAHTAIQVPSSCVTSSLATTDFLTNKMIHSDVVATPSNTTASVPPVTANLGPLQPVGPIADIPSLKAPRYIWTWTILPTVNWSHSTVPHVQRQENSSIVAAPSVSPSAQTRFGHHSAPPCELANLRWTFNPQNAIATFRRLAKSAPSPSPKPSLNIPLPLPEAPGEGTDLPNAAPAYIRSLQSSYCNQICSKPNHQPVLRLSKRHRDALKVKLYHLYANILSMIWFYGTFD